MNQLIITLIPTPEDYQILDIFMGGTGLIDPADLRDVALPDGIDWGKGVILNGRAPIWLYATLVHKCHIAAWVATYSPRDGAVVVQTHKTIGPQLGDVLPSSGIQPFLPKHENIPSNRSPKEEPKGKIICFIGQPHSGKSVLMNALRQELRKVLSPEFFQREFFILRAAPDGEGDWFADIPAAEEMTFRYKNRFDDTFIEHICTQLSLLKEQKSLLFVDCGGKIDKRNQRILNLCTHAIIVYQGETILPEWRGAATASDLKILAEVFSVLEEKSEVVNQSPLLFRLGILERGNENLRVPRNFIKILIPEGNIDIT